MSAAPAYSYIYAWRTPVLDDRVGTFHASEISITLDNAEICTHYSAGDPGAPGALALAKQMSGTWVSFARTGNPNHSNLPFWPAFDATGRATMYFNTPCKVRNNAEGKGLASIVGSAKA